MILIPSTNTRVFSPKVFVNVLLATFIVLLYVLDKFVNVRLTLLEEGISPNVKLTGIIAEEALFEVGLIKVGASVAASNVTLVIVLDVIVTKLIERLKEAFIE